MKITCTLEHLKDGLKKIEGIAKGNISLPILENILIEAKEGILFFSATNLEIGVITQVIAKVEEEGSIVITPNILQGFLNAISGNDNVFISSESNILSLQCGSSKTSINGLDASEFPIIPQKNNDSFFSMDLEKFQKNLRSVVSFASTNDMRPELTGVIFQKKEDIICFAATDSFRLGESKINSQKIISSNEELFSNKSVIIPQKLSNYINKISSSEDILCSVEDSHFFLRFGNTNVTARLIDGVYPDYTQIIPTSTNTNIKLKKKDLVEAMKIMLVFASQENQDVVFEISNNKIKITTDAGERGGGEAEVSANIEGEDQNIVLNPKYVLDGLQNIDKEEIFIGINSKASPIIFRGMDGIDVSRDYTYIVMPVKS